MSLYALVRDGAVIETRDHAETPPTLSLNKGAWLPVVDLPDPTFDPIIQVLGATPILTVDGAVVKRQRKAFHKPISVVKADRKAAAEAAFAQRMAAGFTPATGPLAGHVLQVRTIEDRTNWLTSQAAYMAAIAGGQGGAPGATFRDAANENVTVTYAEGHDALMQMAAWGEAGYHNLWSLKDQIEQAATIAEVAAIDVEAGW